MADKLQATKTKPQKIWNLDIGEQIRNEELDGRKFVVVPMTMILEGVHTGSQGPVYYSVEELAKTPKMWNMKPIVIEHPFRGDTATDLEVYKKQAVGMIMNTYFDPDEGKLKAEAWIDKDLAQNKYPQLLEHIEHRLPMEVSTGLFSELILEPGTWKGEEYKGRIVNIRADHLAILPHKQGACSLADGAGLLINESFEEAAPNDGREQLFVFSTVINEYPPGTPLIDESPSADEEQYAEKKPRLTNSPTEVKKMMNPIQSSSHPYELDTDQFKMIIIPKPSGLGVKKAVIPQTSVANYSEPDEEDLPLPEKKEEAIQDNAKILTPEEQQAEAIEDSKTGKKDHYIELRNRLAAALIRRHIRGPKNSKKKSTKRVRNEGEKQDSPSYPSLALGDDSFRWDTAYKDVFFKTQEKLYDALVNRARYEKFNNDTEALRSIISQLTSLLLVTFPVSSIGKVRGLMEFAKSEPSDQAVFAPEDIALVEHTIGQIDQAKKDQDILSEAFQGFKSKVSTRGSNDLFYSSPANFLTGVMKASFSPLSSRQIKVDLSAFSTESEKLYQKGKVNSDTAADKIALKLNISPEDTPETFEAKQRLGSAAIILGKYAEKGLYSDIFQKLLVGDSRDEKMRAVLSTIRRLLRCIFTGKVGKDIDADADPFFQRWARSPNAEDHLYADRYARCREYIQRIYTPGISKDLQDGLKDALTKELKVIVGLRHDTEATPDGPHGIIGFTKRHIPSLKRNRLIPLYAKELIDMSLMQLDYDHALKMAQEEYALALENIDALGLPDDTKAEFVALPETLFDPERQKKIATSIRNAGKLKKLLFRRNLSRIYGTTDSMDTALSLEMLRAIGAVPDSLYDSTEEWLSTVRLDGSDRLVDLVSSLPDPRSEARAILSEDPDIIQSVLGGYKTSDPEIQKKVDEFVNTFEAPTRSELLSKHSPEYRAMNDEIYQFMRSLDTYDPETGFTPEQQAYLTDHGWFADWFKQNRSTRGYVDYLEEWKKNGADPEKKFYGFKPQKYMLDNLLSVMRNKMVEKRFPIDKLLEKNRELGSDIVELIQSAPSQSRLVAPDWATNKFTARLGRYAFDPDGSKQLEGDLVGDPVQTKITMLYKAFKDQFIATKANVLIDHFMMSQEGEPIEGEVSVENV